VSAPCTWKEVERGDVEPQTFTIRNMAARVHNAGDPWNDMRRRRRSLKGAIEKLKRLNQR
jgi:bifunctional non-homologous end joining protein LigD